jgi:hypothetical protein
MCASAFEGLYNNNIIYGKEYGCEICVRLGDYQLLNFEVNRKALFPIVRK